MGHAFLVVFNIEKHLNSCILLCVCLILGMLIWWRVGMGGLDEGKSFKNCYILIFMVLFSLCLALSASIFFPLFLRWTSGLSLHI